MTSVIVPAFILSLFVSNAYSATPDEKDAPALYRQSTHCTSDPTHYIIDFLRGEATDRDKSTLYLRVCKTLVWKHQPTPFATIVYTYTNDEEEEKNMQLSLTAQLVQDNMTGLMTKMFFVKQNRGASPWLFSAEEDLIDQPSWIEYITHPEDPQKLLQTTICFPLTQNFTLTIGANSLRLNQLTVAGGTKKYILNFWRGIISIDNFNHDRDAVTSPTYAPPLVEHQQSVSISDEKGMNIIFAEQTLNSCLYSIVSGTYSSYLITTIQTPPTSFLDWSSGKVLLAKCEYIVMTENSKKVTTLLLEGATLLPTTQEQKAIYEITATGLGKNATVIDRFSQTTTPQSQTNVVMGLQRDTLHHPENNSVYCSITLPHITLKVFACGVQICKPPKANTPSALFEHTNQDQFFPINP